MTCKWLVDNSGYPFFKYTNSFKQKYVAKYNCPKQGPYKNCHLISALSSIAWVNDAVIIQKFADVNKVNYLFSFYDYDPDMGMYPPGQAVLNPNTVEVKVAVNPKIFKDDTTGIWCCSRGCDETWVAMYEKAFAKFCLFRFAKKMTFADLLKPEVDPVFSNLPNGSDWGGNPASVMKYLTNNTVKKYWNLIAGNAGVYEQIRVLCDYYDKIGQIEVVFSDGSKAKITGCMTKYPTGAWTYLDNTDAKNNNGGTSVNYDNSTIVADHCYSILGIYEDAVGVGKYIVLRNPYGVNDPALPSLGKGPWIIKRNLYKIGLNYLPTEPGGAGLSLTFSDADGIFALDVTSFKNYFKGYGYIV